MHEKFLSVKIKFEKGKKKRKKKKKKKEGLMKASETFVIQVNLPAVIPSVVSWISEGRERT